MPMYQNRVECGIQVCELSVYHRDVSDAQIFKDPILVFRPDISTTFGYLREHLRHGDALPIGAAPKKSSMERLASMFPDLSCGM